MKTLHIIIGSFICLFSILSCNNESELAVCQIDDEKRTKAIEGPSHIMFSVSDFWGEEKDEVIAAIREKRIIILGAYGATLEQHEKWPPSDFDLGMTMVGGREEYCPFDVLLTGSGGDDICLVTNGNSLNMPHMAGQYARCVIAFNSDGTPFFRYITGDSYYDKNYLFVRLGMNPVAYGPGFEKTIESQPIDLLLLKGYYISDSDYRTMDKCP